MSPFFSVAIPAYNAEAFIADTLDSVAGQSWSDLEIIVTDDGSRDRTAEVTCTWLGAHPQVRGRMVSQPNKGIGGARNTCLRHATGTFVAFLDADDAWEPEKLSVMADRLRHAGAPDVLCHDQWSDDGQSRRRLRSGPYRTFEALLFGGNCLFTSATTVRRSRLEEVGGFSEDLAFNGVEDWELWIRLARAGAAFDYEARPLGIYRSGQGISADVDSQCRHSFNVFERHYASIEGPSVRHRWLRRHYRSAMLRWAGNALRRQGHPRRASHYLSRALKENPLNWKAWLVMAAVAGRAVSTSSPPESPHA